MFDMVKRIMAFCRDVCQAMADYYIDAGCEFIAMVDPMTSQIGPDQFRDFVSPFMKPVFDHVRSRNALSSFFVCGHAQKEYRRHVRMPTRQYLGRRKYPVAVRPRVMPAHKGSVSAETCN